jgi:hypothetical protein
LLVFITFAQTSIKENLNPFEGSFTAFFGATKFLDIQGSGNTIFAHRLYAVGASVPLFPWFVAPGTVSGLENFVSHC